MNRAIWVNEGTFVQSFDRLRQLQVDAIFLSARGHSRAEVDKVYSEGFTCGLYSNPQWYGFDLDGRTVDEAAKENRIRFSRQITAMGGDNRDMPVQLNMEKGAALSAGLPDGGKDYIRRWFYWWRKVRPNRWTSWTMEGFQGGWYTTTTFNAPELAGAYLSPQAYGSDPRTDRWDSWGTAKDLIDWGVVPRRLVPFNEVNQLKIRGATGFFYMDHLIT